MKPGKDPHRTGSHAPQARADELFVDVFNDEEDALSNEQLALTHQRDMPALQEFLREMSELDSRHSLPFLH